MISPAEKLLQELEFARPTRYGRACPKCGGSEREDYGYVERGPDRGHEVGCALRAELDRIAAKLPERWRCVSTHERFDLIEVRYDEAMRVEYARFHCPSMGWTWGPYCSREAILRDLEPEA